MRKTTSNLLFCVLLLLTSFALYQSILIQKKLSTIMITKTGNSQFYQSEDQSALSSLIESQAHFSTKYIFPNYLNFEWPTEAKDCTYYESALLGFQTSVTEVGKLSGISTPTVNSTIYDPNTQITFNYLEYSDDAVLTTAQKKTINDNLNASIAKLKDIIENDKCNFVTRWKNSAGKYLCSSTSGSVSGAGTVNDKCTKFKMYYQGQSGTKRKYCFQNMNTGYFCTAEQYGNIEFTCSRTWCLQWEIMSTTSKRSNGTFTWTEMGGRYLYVDSSLNTYANLSTLNNNAKFVAELI